MSSATGIRLLYCEMERPGNLPYYPPKQHYGLCRSTSMVWPTLGSRMAKEQNRTVTNISKSFIYKMAAKINYGKKLRHCHPMYTPTVATRPPLGNQPIVFLADQRRVNIVLTAYISRVFHVRAFATPRSILSHRARTVRHYLPSITRWRHCQHRRSSRFLYGIT